MSDAWLLPSVRSPSSVRPPSVLRPSSVRPSVLPPSFRPSSPNLLCQLLIAVILAGPSLPALDRSGPCRTPTASARSLWASLDLHRRDSERCGPRRASTGEILGAVGLAGPQPDFNGQKQSHIECQRKCQI